MAGSGPVLIAGAGALGSVVGGLLARAGWPVTLLGRRAHLDTVGSRGLLIEGLFGTHRVTGLSCVVSVEGLRGPYETVFLTVKAYDSEAMAAAVAPHLAPDGVLVSLQNGLGNLEAAARAVGGARVLGARVIFGAEVAEPGRARVTVYADPVLIGSPDPFDTRRRADGVTLRWGAAEDYREEFYRRLVPATAAHRSSMLQDLERGRPTEIEAINGWVAARAAAHGVPAPVNATLTRLLRARARLPATEARWSR